MTDQGKNLLLCAGRRNKVSNVDVNQWQEEGFQGYNCTLHSAIH